MILVVNKRRHVHDPAFHDEYIGRGSALGNKWTHAPGRMTLAKYVVDSEGEAVAKYREWLRDQLGDPGSDAYIQIRRIVSMAQRYEVKLVCYSMEEGQIVKEAAELIMNNLLQ